jgi:glucosamine--fructose-6-phosphate aminotransferase (isomerizing)
MCGIYGYIGKKAAHSIILDGLQKLEYRGYDSWGMVTLVNGELHWRKRLGCITKRDVAEIALPGKIGLGHVRWATHGLVSERNAHPHSDCKQEIAVVHNGVIYNEASLKSRLSRGGHSFSSETDTEVFAHLLEEKREQDFIDAIHNCVQEIEAQYSFLILTKREPDRIYAARNKSPLKIGIGRNEFHISSDIVSLVGVVDE